MLQATRQPNTFTFKSTFKEIFYLNLNNKTFLEEIKLFLSVYTAIKRKPSENIIYLVHALCISYSQEKREVCLLIFFLKVAQIRETGWLHADSVNMLNLNHTCKFAWWQMVFQDFSDFWVTVRISREDFRNCVTHVGTLRWTWNFNKQYLGWGNFYWNLYGQPWGAPATFKLLHSFECNSMHEFRM